MYWSAYFHLPLPVPFAISSKGNRIVVVLSFRVCKSAVFILPPPVSFAFISDRNRNIVVLYLGLFAGSSVLHWVFGYSLCLRVFTGCAGDPSTTTGSACLHSEGRRTTVVLYLWDLADYVFNLNIPPQNSGIIDDCLFYFWLPRTRGIILPLAFAFFVKYITPLGSTGLLIVKAAGR